MLGDAAIIPLKPMFAPALRRKLTVSAAFLLAVAYLFLPANASAAPADVCGPSSTNCNKFITEFVNPAIIVLTALVGIAAIISIIYAGIQYASSADDPGAVSKAKQRIFNTIIGLVAYIFLFAFLNYLVPGGIF